MCGGTTSTGYKVLDSHIGAIYGDSINYDRAKRILETEDKGFASTNVVLGIGSYSLQFVTRDTQAQKATYIEIENWYRNI
jgi:nicotinamide phosphoribosyltransferase